MPTPLLGKVTPPAPTLFASGSFTPPALPSNALAGIPCGVPSCAGVPPPVASLRLFDGPLANALGGNCDGEPRDVDGCANCPPGFLDGLRAWNIGEFVPKFAFPKCD